MSLPNEDGFAVSQVFLYTSNGNKTYFQIIKLHNNKSVTYKYMCNSFTYWQTAKESYKEFLRTLTSGTGSIQLLENTTVDEAGRIVTSYKTKIESKYRF